MEINILEIWLIKNVMEKDSCIFQMEINIQESLKMISSMAKGVICIKMEIIMKVILIKDNLMEWANLDI